MNSLKRLSCLAALLSIGTLSGCAAGGGYQAYEPAQSTPITSVAILAPMTPVSYSLNNQGSGAKAFGLIGALVDSSGDMENAKKLDNLLKESGFDFGTAFTDAVKSELEADGYSVSIVEVERENSRAEAGDDPALNDVRADALLDITVQAVGYANESVVNNDFRPDIQVHVNLLSQATREKLYSETFMYGYSNPFMGGTDIDAPKDYYFDGHEQLFQDSEKVVEGLREGVDAVAARIAERLHST